MSNIANLHSLLGGHWLITDEFANSLYPYIVNILSKGGNLESKKPKSEICFVNSSQAIFNEEEYYEIQSESTDIFVAILPIKTPILKYSQDCGPVGTQSMCLSMEKWKYDPRLAGVLLDMDTGGGQVAGTAEFSEYVNRYPKPVVAYTDGTLASAGYYIASAAKEIVANKHSNTIGSIGTMTKYLMLDSYFEKTGAKVVEAYASKSTKKNHSHREAKNGNLEPLIETELNPINEKFHSEIIQYRPKINVSVFDGRHIHETEEALELNLIDKIGDRTYAINRVFEISNECQKKRQHNNTHMEEQTINLKNISSTLGLEGNLKLSSKLFGGKKGAFLTVDQLNQIEARLMKDSENLIKEQKLLVEANTKLESLEEVTKNALSKAQLKYNNDMEASIKMLANKVVLYGRQPGGNHSLNMANGDRFEEENTIVEENDNHNQIYKTV